MLYSNWPCNLECKGNNCSCFSLSAVCIMLLTLPGSTQHWLPCYNQVLGETGFDIFLINFHIFLLSNLNKHGIALYKTTWFVVLDNFAIKNGKCITVCTGYTNMQPMVCPKNVLIKSTSSSTWQLFLRTMLLTALHRIYYYYFFLAGDQTQTSTWPNRNQNFESRNLGCLFAKSFWNINLRKMLWKLFSLSCIKYIFFGFYWSIGFKANIEYT